MLQAPPYTSAAEQAAAAAAAAEAAALAAAAAGASDSAGRALQDMMGGRLTRVTDDVAELAAARPAWMAADPAGFTEQQYTHLPLSEKKLSMS